MNIYRRRTRKREYHSRGILLRLEFVGYFIRRRGGRMWQLGVSPPVGSHLKLFFPSLLKFRENFFKRYILCNRLI